MKSHLKYYREQAGLTQAKLAAQTNLSIGTVALMENGRRDGSIDTIVLMAKFFGVSVDDFLFGPDTTNSTRNKQPEEVS